MDVSSFLKTFKKKASQKLANSAGDPTPSLEVPQEREELEESLHSSDAESAAESNPGNDNPLEKPTLSIAARQASRYQRQGLKMNRNYELEPLRVISDHENSGASRNGIYNRKMALAKAVDRRPLQPRPRDETADVFWKDLLRERQKLKRLSDIDLPTVVDSPNLTENTNTSLEDRLVSVDKLLSSSENNPIETSNSSNIVDILAFLTSVNDSAVRVAKTHTHSEAVEAKLDEKAHANAIASEAADSSPSAPQTTMLERQLAVPGKKQSMFQRAKALTKQ